MPDWAAAAAAASGAAAAAWRSTKQTAPRAVTGGGVHPQPYLGGPRRLQQLKLSERVRWGEDGSVCSVRHEFRAAEACTSNVHAARRCASNVCPGSSPATLALVPAISPPLPPSPTCVRPPPRVAVGSAEPSWVSSCSRLGGWVKRHWDFEGQGMARYALQAAAQRTMPSFLPSQACSACACRRAPACGGACSCPAPRPERARPPPQRAACRLEAAKRKREGEGRGGSREWWRARHKVARRSVRHHAAWPVTCPGPWAIRQLRWSSKAGIDSPPPPPPPPEGGSIASSHPGRPRCRPEGHPPAGPTAGRRHAALTTWVNKRTWEEVGGGGQRGRW